MAHSTSVHVAFFRNLNLGHRGSPSRAQLVETFLAEGASNIRSHQTNGTVSFSADDAAATARAVTGRLGAVCGYADVVLVRDLDDVAAVLAQPRPDRSVEAYRETVTFTDDTVPRRDPWTNPAATVRITHVGTDFVLGEQHRVGSVVGNPTAVVEAAFGVRATTRTRGTLERLVAAARRA